MGDTAHTAEAAIGGRGPSFGEFEYRLTAAVATSGPGPTLLALVAARPPPRSDPNTTKSM